MKATIDREQFRRALAAVSLALSPGDPKRDYAGFVLIEANTDHVAIVACNGHWLAVYRAPTLAGPRISYQPGAEPAAPVPTACADEPSQLLIAAADVPTLLTWIKSRGKSGAVQIDTDGTFEASCATHTVKPGECHYPPYASVMAAATPSAVLKPHAIGLSLDYVAAIAKAFDRADAPYPIMLFGGCDNPVTISSKYGNLTCVLMTIDLHPVPAADAGEGGAS